MLKLASYPSFFISAPLTVSITVALIAFNIPADYYTSIFLLSLYIVMLVLLDIMLFEHNKKYNVVCSKADILNTNHSKIALPFGIIIALTCVIELIIYGFPILNPSTYASFENGRLHFRHISNMCWVLVPIGSICLKNKWIYFIFITIAILFPILVLDRNRLLAVIFSFFVIRFYSENKKTPLFKYVAIILSALSLFSLLGIYRSGTLAQIELPTSNFFLNASLPLQWILLYISCGIYNLISIMSSGFTDPSILINQTFPALGYESGLTIPLEAANINVGSEFLPFILAFGKTGLFIGVFLLYCMIFTSLRLLKRFTNIFTLLIFIKVSYTCIMSPFAPQAFIWTNFGFILLCFFLWLLAIILPKNI